jgi:hypothetical protein
VKENPEEYAEYAAVAAARAVPPLPIKKDECSICGVKIETAAFKGTGVCCDLHRKERDGDDQAHLKPVVYHKTGFREEWE